MDALNRFAVNPTSVNIPRSKFDRSFSHKTTFDSGKLIPIYLDEALPGDTISLDTGAVVRMSTPIHPVMDNAFVDVYYFAIPYRLLWEHTKEFFGENTSGPWEQTTEYLLPQVRLWTIKSGSLADYFGLPLYDGIAGETQYAPTVSALPFRAYALIWNEWFRDQNVSTPIPINKGDSIVSLSDDNTGDWFQGIGNPKPETNFFWNHCYPLPVGKFHDYFTSALPEPQKGPDVLLPLGDLAPLTTTDTMHKMSDDPYEGIKFGTTEDDGVAAGFFNLILSNENLPPNDFRLMSGNAYVSGSQAGAAITHSNVYADLSEAASATINSFRQALAIQGLYEKDARGGTRYREIIKSHFGVTSLDARQQIPEFLCGKRIPVTMAQVLQTSSTDSTSPQGNTAAYSLTQDVGSSFTYSATEHCLIMGLACVRTFQTYSQRIEKMWSRRRRFDFYWPVFANLGEQPIYNRELYYAQTASDAAMSAPNDVFAFQEAFAEYRYKPNMLSGLFRPQAAQSLDVWHYGEEFASTPTLSPAFIYQNKDVVSRTLAVTDEPQFIADFRFQQTWVRPMPMYSIPALLGRM